MGAAAVFGDSAQAGRRVGVSEPQRGATLGVNVRGWLRTPTPAHTAVRRRYRGGYAGVVTHGLKKAADGWKAD